MAVFLLYMASPIIIYLIIELFAKESVNNNEKMKNRYLFFVAITMILMIGLRNPNNGSGDTKFYCDFWQDMSRVEFSQLRSHMDNIDFEKGFQLFVWIFSHFLNSPQWLLIITGILYASAVCFFIKHNCRNVVLAVTIFNCLGLFHFMVQGMRQAIAMCICIFAIEQCKKKKFIFFLAMVVFAMQFHASAIVFSAVYFFRYFKLNYKSGFLFMMICLIVVNYIPRIFEIINTVINDDYLTGKGSEDGGGIAIIIYIAIIIFGAIFKDPNDENYPIYMYMTLVGASCMILRQSVSGILERVGFYYAFSQMPVVSNSIYFVGGKNFHVLIKAGIAILCLIVAAYKASYSELVPYLFFWQ